MKKYLFLVIALFLLAGCQTGEKDYITIGVILPLTGDAAIYGQAMKNGIDLAYHNSKIKDNIKLVYEDDLGDNLGALNAGHIMLNRKADVVIGGSQSKTADVLIPLLSRNKIPLISPGASATDFDSIPNYFFRLWPSDSYDGQVIANFIYNNMDSPKVAVFFTNSKYGYGIKNVFEKIMKSKSIEIVFSEPFTEGNTDFRTQLLKIQKSGANILFLPGYYAEVYIIIKQIRELGLDLTIIGTSSFRDEKLIDRLGENMNGLLFSYPSLDNNNINAIEFEEKYKALYNESPNVFATNAYDCFKLIEYAIINGASNSEEIIHKLNTIESFSGAGGRLTFNDYGSVIKPFNIYVVDNNQYLKKK